MEISIEIILRPYNIRDGYINISKKWWHLFPDITCNIEVELKPMGVIQSQFYVEVGGSHHGFSRKLRPWFTENNLQAGDKIGIKPIIDMKKYRLEILK